MEKRGDVAYVHQRYKDTQLETACAASLHKSKPSVNVTELPK